MCNFPNYAQHELHEEDNQQLHMNVKEQHKDVTRLLYLIVKACLYFCHNSLACKGVLCEGKAVQALELWKFRLPKFLDKRHMKVVRLSALHTCHFYPLGYISGTHFCKRLIRPWSHSAAQ